MPDDIKVDNINPFITDKDISNVRDISKETGIYGNIIEQLGGSLFSVGKVLESNAALTKEQAFGLNILSHAALGTVDAFNKFGNIKFDNLNTFSGQIQNIFSDLEKGGSLTSSVLNKVGDALGKSFVGMPVEQAISLAKQMAIGADNTMRLQSAYMQTAAASGNLGDAWRASGGDLKKINELSQEQNRIMNESSKITGVTKDQTMQYWAALEKIPKSLDDSINKQDNLIKVIQASQGTGRDTNYIINDMSIAYKNFGINGEAALNFSVKMSEVSQKTHTDISVVESSVKSLSDHFKTFGDQTNSTTNILLNYVGALKETKISGDAAIEITSGMIDKLKDFSIGQKALLSAQTGGPGGLMGGFQIEKMMRDGKTDEVMEKVMSTMKKQFGRIVTVDDASKSQGDAAMLVKQRQMLTQGPFKIAGNEDQAEKILEMMQGRQLGKPGFEKGEQSTDFLKQSIDKGNTIEQQSYTKLSEGIAILQQIRDNTSFQDYNMMSDTFASGTGKNDLNASRDNAVKESENTKAINARGLKTNSINIDLNNAIIRDSKKDMNYINSIPTEGNRFVDNFKDKVYTPDNTKERNEKELKSIQIDAEKNRMKLKDESLSPEIRKSINQNLEKDKVREDILLNKKPEHNQHTDQQGKAINVNISGMCFKCKREIDLGNSNSQSVAPGAALRGQ